MERKQNLDYMGQAVVNTAAYLKNYQKIFWELPLFFIYRTFYILRLKLTRQLQAFQDPKVFGQLMEENDQIGSAVTKMAKVVFRKLKKGDPDVLNDIKEYLNTQEHVNCDVPMKSLLGQYIGSLNQASEEYPELLQHQIEVVDAYLIAKGNRIDPFKQKQTVT